MQIQIWNTGQNFDLIHQKQPPYTHLDLAVTDLRLNFSSKTKEGEKKKSRKFSMNSSVHQQNFLETF